MSDIILDTLNRLRRENPRPFFPGVRLEPPTKGGNDSRYAEKLRADTQSIVPSVPETERYHGSRRMTRHAMQQVRRRAKVLSRAIQANGLHLRPRSTRGCQSFVEKIRSLAKEHPGKSTFEISLPADFLDIDSEEDALHVIRVSLSSGEDAADEVNQRKKAALWMEGTSHIRMAPWGRPTQDTIAWYQKYDLGLSLQSQRSAKYANTASTGVAQCDPVDQLAFYSALRPGGAKEFWKGSVLESEAFPHD